MNELDLGSLTPEEREYIMRNLPDLSGQEDEITHQLSLANALRVRPTQRMDTASQLSRALSGIGSGYQTGLAAQGRKELGGKYRTFAGGLADALRRKEMPGGYGYFAGEEMPYG